MVSLRVAPPTDSLPVLLVLKGTVLDADGTSAGGGLVVQVDGFSFVSFTTRADGTYGLVFLDFTGRKIAVGDVIQISVTDDGTEVASESYTVTANVLTTDNQPVKVNLDINHFRYYVLIG